MSWATKSNKSTQHEDLNGSTDLELKYELNDWLTEGK